MLSVSLYAEVTPGGVDKITSSKMPTSTPPSIVVTGPEDEVDPQLSYNLTCLAQVVELYPRCSAFSFPTFLGPFAYNRDEVINFLRVLQSSKSFPKELVGYFMSRISIRVGSVY